VDDDDADDDDGDGDGGGIEGDLEVGTSGVTRSTVSTTIENETRKC
jgi:hypothetical protein